MDSTIKRGTTPSIILDFSDITDFTVADIAELSMTMYGRTTSRHFNLEDMDVEVATLSYHFTQEETLALRANETYKFDADILLTNGERYGLTGFPAMVNIKQTKTDEVMVDG